MNAPAEAFRYQALANEIAAELRAKYDLKAAYLPVNVCLLRSSIMSRAVGMLCCAAQQNRPVNVCWGSFVSIQLIQPARGRSVAPPIAAITQPDEPPSGANELKIASRYRRAPS